MTTAAESLARPVSRVAPARRRLCMWMAAVAAATGLVLMHTATGTSTEHLGSMTSAKVAKAGLATVADATSHVHRTAADAPGDGLSGGMLDCGPLMIMCLTLLVAIGARLARRPEFDRFWWSRPRPSTSAAVSPRPPIGILSPLERTSVLRC